MDMMRNTCLAIIGALCISGQATAVSIYEFNFTGRFTVVAPDNSVITNFGTTAFDAYGMQTPIQATMSYDMDTGVGSVGLIVAPFSFFGSDVQFHDISLQAIGDGAGNAGNLLLGNMLVDWNGNNNVPISTVWDASGFFNAVNNTAGGLQVGDKISGTQVLRDTDNNGTFDTVMNGNIGSATPASDGLTFSDATIDQGPAPLATTTFNTTSLCNWTDHMSCYGMAVSGETPLFDDGIAGSPMIDGPFMGLNLTLDIGSGNSLHVTGVPSAVPVPAAVWLFGSGLIGLIGVARRKKA